MTSRWGKQEEAEEAGDPDKPVEPVEKPNFGLSGALAKDRATGNVQNGVVMKWSEPPEARVPQKRYRLYVFKGDDLICTSRLFCVCPCLLIACSPSLSLYLDA